MHSILTAIGADRPGLVDEVSQFIFERGGNIEDSRMVNLRGQFAIRAYSAAEEIVDAKLVEAPAAQAVIDKFFARPDTAFVHVRFPTYGCFACRIDRD